MGGDLDLVADLRGLLARDVPLAQDFDLLYPAGPLVARANLLSRPSCPRRPF